jgi:hypothetical protein
MTLTYEKLKAVMDEIKRLGYEVQVPDNVMDKAIIRFVGASRYTLLATKEALGRAGMIRRNSNGLYDIEKDG